MSALNTELTKRFVNVGELNRELILNLPNTNDQMEIGGGEEGEVGVQLDNDILHTFLPEPNSRATGIGEMEIDSTET